jgi:TATA-box binding protein (TBP) (component of TFIID and TFIIIB)
VRRFIQVQKQKHHCQIPAKEIDIGLTTPLYTIHFIREIVAALGLGTTTYLPSNFKGIVFRLQQK